MDVCVYIYVCVYENLDECLCVDLFVCVYICLCVLQIQIWLPYNKDKILAQKLYRIFQTASRTTENTILANKEIFKSFWEW